MDWLNITYTHVQYTVIVCHTHKDELINNTFFFFENLKTPKHAIESV